MVKLRFLSVFLPALEVGPQGAISFNRGALVDQPSGRVIARYADKLWVAGGIGFVRIEFEGLVPLALRFLNSSPSSSSAIAPVQAGHVAEDGIYVNARMVARYNDAFRTWRSNADSSTEWHTILAEPMA